TNRIRIELCSQSPGAEREAEAETAAAASASESSTTSGLWIEFDERHDALIAGIEGPGWLPRLSEEQTRVLSMALIGLFKMCGIDWVRAVPDSHSHAGAAVLERAAVPVPTPGSESHAEGHDRAFLREHRGATPARGEGEPIATILLPFSSVVVT